MIDSFKDHTGKLTGTWLVGLLTWVSGATNFVGLLGALVGLGAGIMLVAIRWDDFVNSKPVKRILALFGREE